MSSIIKTENHPINVSSKVLRHISRGIYRSPAGALKELVSNSYDAGASKVTINTNYPSLNKITVIDNGKGISIDDFKRIIEQIGLSEKEVGEEIEIINSSSKKRRKVIGHYGIGFLAIGQLTSNAVITSKVKNTHIGIRATLNFEQFEKATTKESAEKLQIGECQIETVEFEGNKTDSFTKIELDDIRSDVKRTILGEDSSKLNVKAEEQRPYSANFDDIIELLRKKESESSTKNKLVLRDYSYEELLWELAVYAPLPFPESSGFKKKGKLAHFSELANNFEFELVADGFILKKPYDDFFWSSKLGYPPYIFHWENEEYSPGKKVSAFIVYQPATMIRPKKMQGILIRENGVSVGMYDLTFMRYPFNEGSKFNSLTGEIFATGLSDSMNVDRDSFNQTHDDYVALKNWFHTKLFEEVFSHIQKFTTEKSSPTRTKNLELIQAVLDEISKNSEKINKVDFRPLGKEEKRMLFTEKKTLVINEDHKNCNLSTVNRERLLLASALIMHGYIAPVDFESVFDEIEKIKKQVKV